MFSGKPNYYDAIKRLTGGKDVSFARFLTFHRLNRRYNDLRNSSQELDAVASAFLELLEFLGYDTSLPDPQLDVGMTEDLKDFDYPPLLEWQKPSPKDDKEDKTGETKISAFDYEGRQLAYVVATLANTFGWTADYILNTLTYYEAMMYMQEALLIYHERHQWEYVLSTDLGIKKVGEDYIKEPYPKPFWMKETTKFDKKKFAPLPDRFKPDGVIVDYTMKPGEGVKYVIEHKEDTSNQGEAKSRPDDLPTKDIGDSDIGQALADLDNQASSVGLDQ